MSLTTQPSGLDDRPEDHDHPSTDGGRVAWAVGRDGAPTRRRLPGGLVAAAMVITVWWLVTEAEVWSPVLLPSPPKVWAAFVQSVTTHHGVRGLSGYLLWEHLLASLRRILYGVALGIVVGLPIGLLLGIWRPFDWIAQPAVSFLRSLPPLGYFSLLIIWFGIDDTSKVWLLFLAAFPPVALTVAASVTAIRTERLHVALVLGAGRCRLIRHTVLPSVLPDLLTGIRVAVGFAWTTIVAAETSNGIPGIGGLAWATKKELRTDVAILCVIVIGLTAVALDAALRRVERRLVPWRGRG